MSVFFYFTFMEQFSDEFQQRRAAESAYSFAHLDPADNMKMKVFHRLTRIVAAVGNYAVTALESLFGGDLGNYLKALGHNA